LQNRGGTATEHDTAPAVHGGEAGARMPTVSYWKVSGWIMGWGGYPWLWAVVEGEE
jgi:hypothetical protein